MCVSEHDAIVFDSFEDAAEILHELRTDPPSGVHYEYSIVPIVGKSGPLSDNPDAVCHGFGILASDDNGPVSFI